MFYYAATAASSPLARHRSNEQYLRVLQPRQRATFKCSLHCSCGTIGSPSPLKGKESKTFYMLYRRRKRDTTCDNGFYRVGSCRGVSSSIFSDPVSETDTAVTPLPSPPLSFLFPLCRAQVLYIRREEVDAVRPGSFEIYFRQFGRRQEGAFGGGDGLEGEVEGRRTIVDHMKQAHDRLRQRS